MRSSHLESTMKFPRCAASYVRISTNHHATVTQMNWRLYPLADFLASKVSFFHFSFLLLFYFYIIYIYIYIYCIANTLPILSSSLSFSLSLCEKVKLKTLNHLFFLGVQAEHFGFFLSLSVLDEHELCVHLSGGGSYSIFAPKLVKNWVKKQLFFVCYVFSREQNRG